MSAVRAVSVTQGALPIIFLDIDEVICMSSPWGGFDAIAAVNGRHIRPAQVYQGLFASSAISALEHIHGEMDAALRYVISSTWRESFSREQLEIVFRSAGLGFVADNLHKGDRWCTPPKFGRSRRVNEIAEWLDRHHQGEPFAIIDDTCSGASLALALEPARAAALMPLPTDPSNVPAQRHSRNEVPHPFSGRVVLCEEHVGLTDAHVPFIVAALRREVVAPGRLDAALTESEAPS